MSNRLKTIFRNLLRGSSVERELNEEVSACLAVMIEEKANGGVDLERARRSAAIEFGGIDQVKERVRDIRSPHPDCDRVPVCCNYLDRFLAACPSRVARRPGGGSAL
ncbi:MAG TPA: permease prefix domain 1-containing protein [Blastocatellia bacterium]|nr:permease prefix domain 1-containing protein [Blastocatellia bacterium]